MRTNFGSFTSQPKLDLKPFTLADKFLSEFGEITNLYGKTNLKYLCDVRLYSGVYIDNVPLPGAFYDSKTGYYSGIKMPFFLGQRVAVGFMNNNKDVPYIIQVYPFDGGSKTKGQLDNETDYKADEMSIGHISGHKTEWKEDKIVFLDKGLEIRQSIDYDTKKYLLDFGTSKIEVENGTKIKLTLDGTKYITIDATGIEVKSGSSATEKSVLGEKLKSKLEELIDAITALTVTSSAPGAPSGTPLNAASFNQIKSALTEILSDTTKNN